MHSVERGARGRDVSGLGQQVRVPGQDERLRRRIVPHGAQERIGRLERVRHGGRAPGEVHRAHAREPARERVGETVGEDTQTVDRLARGRRASDRHARQVRDPARAEQRLVVVVGGEELDAALRERVEPLDGRCRRGQLELDLAPAERRMFPRHLAHRRASVELVQDTQRVGVAACVDERLGELDEDPCALRLVRR